MDAIKDARGAPKETSITYKNNIINFDSLIDEFAKSNKRNVFVTMCVSYYIACISYQIIIILRPNCINKFNLCDFIDEKLLRIYNVCIIYKNIPKQYWYILINYVKIRNGFY